MTNLISLQQAAEQGITMVREPHWRGMDHILIDIVQDPNPSAISLSIAGPWIHIYSPLNSACNSRDPIDIPMPHSIDAPRYEPYTGPLPDSDEYKAAQAEFNRRGRQWDTVNRSDTP